MSRRRVSALRTADPSRVVLAAPVDVTLLLDPEKVCGCLPTTPNLRALDGFGWVCAGCGWGTVT